MNRRSLAVRVALAAGLALAAAAVALGVSLRPADIAGAIERWAAAHPVLLPAVFVAGHLAASLLAAPRTAFCIVAGLLFGLWGGALWSTLAGMLGAAAGFLLARHINGNWLNVESVPRLGPLLLRAEAEGWRLVTLMRILPVVPHAAANYGFGLTRIGFRDYLAGTFLGMIPSTAIYVNLGASGRQALAGSAGWLEPLLWGLALLALSIVAARLLQRRVRL